MSGLEALGFAIGAYLLTGAVAQYAYVRWAYDGTDDLPPPPLFLLLWPLAGLFILCYLGYLVSTVPTALAEKSKERARVKKAEAEREAGQLSLAREQGGEVSLASEGK